MKQLLSILTLAACAVVGGQAHAADKIKVGILLPLTGTFAAVAETQKEGAELAIEVINKRGGLDMPGGKTLIESTVADDEAKQDVGVRRYRYMRDESIKGLGGQTFAPLVYAINALVAKDPIPYYPVCITPLEALQKGKLADSTFAAAYSPWTVGYMAGQSAIKNLGKKKIYFLARSDSWGWDIRDGVKAAAKDYGAELVGYDEVSLGTSDFTTVLQKVRAAKPDVFISAQFAADAVALLKQVQQMGLNKETTIFNAFMTNVVAKGVTPEALENVYAMHYFYHDLTGFVDKEVAKSAKDFSDLYSAKYGRPPDSYAAIAYIAYMEMFRGFEVAKSYDATKVAAVMRTNNGSFPSIKGPARWREDHSAEYKYAAFLVKGKGAKERKNEWDLFTVVDGVGGDKVMPSLKSLGY